jgi:hypothetical protein
MEISQQTLPQQDYRPQNRPAEDRPAEDFHLRPTPDYGTLGPESDIATGTEFSAPAKRARLRSAIAICAGVFLAGLAGNVGSAQAALSHLTDLFAQHSSADGKVPNLASATYRNQLDQMQPREQAEKLLELAINNTTEANEKIAENVDGWRGKIGWDAQLSALTTAALNSNDLQVRQSGLEVQLAAYGLAKNSSTVDLLIQNAASSDHAQKIWALWALGALANRGVETERVEQVLVNHLKGVDEDSRRWAVEALALVGTTGTIAPLLETMHDDPSPAVRELAACSLAESGMLSHDQRLAAVPRLVNYTDDTSLDPQTHAWAFQALGDITKKHLPNDPAAWRSWYASAKGE